MCENQYWPNWIGAEFINQYDLNDLAFDAPILFDGIIREAIKAYDGYGFDPNRVWAYEIETAAITAAQWEVFGGQNVQAKTNRYDCEILKIKNDLMWAGLQPSDTVEVIFWQDNFDPLVSFAKRTKRHAMMKLLEVQYDEFREAGFSFDIIAKILAILRDWAGKLLNLDGSEFENEQSDFDVNEGEDPDLDVAADFFSMFYADVDNVGGSENGGEQPSDTEYAYYP